MRKVAKVILNSGRWMAAAAMMVLVAPSGSAEAALISYTDLGTWSGAVGPSSIETFNGFGADVSFKGVSVALAGGMSVTGTVGTNGAVTQIIDAAPFSFGGFYDINGSTLLLGDVVGANEFVRFDFGTALTAWSIETKGIADGGRPTTIDVFDSSNVLLGTILLASDASNQQVQFYGFQLTGGDEAAYLTITNASQSNDVFGIENVRFVAAAVPEPTSLALFGSAAFGLIVSAVRRRRSHR